MESKNLFQKSKQGFSYSSKQTRKGPAPLASFEDLPLNEQISIDEENYFQQKLELSEKSLEDVFNFNCKQVVQDSQKSSDLTVSPVTNDKFFFKNKTHTSVVKSLNINDLNNQTCKLSRFELPKSSDNLLTIPNSNGHSQNSSPNPKRKGSWTDLFFRGRNRSKSPSNFSEKNIKLEDLKSKKRFFSVFKIRKKFCATLNSKGDQSNVQTPISSFETTTPQISTKNASEEGINSELILDSFDNELKESEQNITNFFEKETLTKQDTLFQKSCLDLILKRKLKSKSIDDTIDDDSRSLPGRLPSSFRDKNDEFSKPIDVVVKVEHYDKTHSSDSESDNDESQSNILDKKVYLKSLTLEDDVEATNLLIQDSVDFEDFCSNELEFSNTNSSPLETQIKSFKRDYLDLNKISVERPRSATPINIAPLEAFIKNKPVTSNPNLNQKQNSKIHLVLPGEKFNNKSPRKINPQSLLDFCEKGLLNYRRSSASIIEKNTEAENNFKLNKQSLSSNKDEMKAFIPNDNNLSQDLTLTSVTPLEFEESLNPFEDEFIPSLVKNENAFILQKECSNCFCQQKQNPNLNPIPSNCSSSDDINLNFNECFEKNDQTFLTPTYCNCNCHPAFWRRISFQRQNPVFSSSSDISSASSRLIQDSSSSSISSSIKNESLKDSFEEVEG